MGYRVNQPEPGRRRFLRLGARVALLGVAAFGLARGFVRRATAAVRPASAPADYDWTKHRWGFGVDATRCIGCLRCVEACKIENGVARDAHHFRTWVERYVHLKGERRARIDSHYDPQNIAASGSEREYRFDNRYRDAPVEQAFFVPKLCNQCENPPCVQVCPVGATYQAGDGVVLVDRKWCIGCGYCIMACPYGARFFHPVHHVAEKCNFCYHRISAGMKPACELACPFGARRIGDINNPDDPVTRIIMNERVSVLKEEYGTKPRNYYVGLSREVR